MSDLLMINTDDLAKKMMGGGYRTNCGKRTKKTNDAHTHEEENGKMRYVGAPYNFVPFTDDVYQYDRGKRIWHNDVLEELLTGEIEYDIFAETDIMVSDGSKYFYKTAYGKYAIPGSTVRGLIRNNVQVLGLSSMGEDIDSYALMYRSVASGPKKEKERYKEVLGVVNNHKNEETGGIATNVRAGYIILKSGKYYINKVKEEFDKKANYLMLSSRYILSHKEDFPFFTQKGKNYMMYTEDCEFERKETINGEYEEKEVVFIIKTENKKEVEEAVENGSFSFKRSKTYFKRGKKTIVMKEIGKPGKFNEEGKLCYKHHKIDRTISYEPKKRSMINENYIPYYAAVFFRLDEKGKRVISVYDRNSGVDSLQSNLRKGYVLSSGWIENKKNLYIIPEEAFKADDTIKIPSNDIRAFLTDLQKRKTTLKRYFKQETDPEKSAEYFFGLPQIEGERKPVFYIELGGRLYFGFTPRLRLFYDYEICQGINRNHKKDILDYSKAIFGYSNKKESYKSKVSFSDAVAEYAEEAHDFRNPILRSPKPTSYLDYLVQGGNDNEQMVTYNDSEMRLRGTKQYWLHRDVVRETQKAKKGQEEQKINEFKPLLGKKTKFHGKIRFWNMTEDELGLLLWSICLVPEKSWMNVGKAKPYGYGNISMKLTSVKRLDKQKAYTLEHFEFDPLTEIDDVDELIGKYKKHINQSLNERKIDDLPSIQDFFRMKDSTIMPVESRIKYMDIDNGEYQSRKKPLPSIEDTVRKQKKWMKTEEEREMGNGTVARNNGDMYQAMVFWKYALQMMGDSDIKEVCYEYGEVKSFDDVVVIYRKEKPFRDSYINTEYFQVKFHEKQISEYTMEDLLDPKAIHATTNSFLQNVVNAYKKDKDKFSKSCYILYTVRGVKQGDVLNKLIKNKDKLFDLEILREGRTEKSEMCRLRKRLCHELDVDEEELVNILRQVCIRDKQEDMIQLEEVLNQGFYAHKLRRWNENGNSYPYYGLVLDWNKNGMKRLTADIIRDYCRRNNLISIDKNIVNIPVTSFGPYSGIGDNCADGLDLTQYLDGRDLKPGYSWEDVFRYSRSFACKKLNHETEYHIIFATSIPVSFMLGRIFNPKSGINVVPFQKNSEGGLVSWGRDDADEQEYCAFEVSAEEEVCAGENDMAISIGVNHKEIRNEVREFIESSQLKIGVYQSFWLEKSDIFSVKNGTHAWQLANQVNNVINQRSGFLKKGKLHLFYAGPAALIFYLGMQSIMYGKIQFYEYDVKRTHENTYYPVIAFPQEGEV